MAAALPLPLSGKRRAFGRACCVDGLLDQVVGLFEGV